MELNVCFLNGYDKIIEKRVVYRCCPSELDDTSLISEE